MSLSIGRRLRQSRMAAVHQPLLIDKVSTARLPVCLGSCSCGMATFAIGRTLACGSHACRYHGLMTIRRFARIAAWIGLAFIIFVTVSPINVRPSTVSTTDLDRAFAFFVMSGLFIVAYPKRVLPIAFALLLAAFAIELMQYLSVTRHPQFHDAVVKAVGVLLGIGCGLLANLVLHSRVRFAGSDRS